MNTSLNSDNVSVHSSERLPALDGLRGVAVLLVVLAHFYRRELLPEADYWTRATMGRIFGAGWMGVELFFVLSGFLITGILLDHKNKSGSLLSFYARRCLRIFPLYFLSLSVIFLILPHIVVFDEGARRIADQQAWLWTYLANLPGIPWVWDDSNLFLLGHFWSLFVEEHFYLFWPLILYLLSGRRLGIACGALVVISIICRVAGIVLGDSTPVILQWQTLGKLDGLAIGAGLAVAVRNNRWKGILFETRWLQWTLLFGVAFCIALACWPRSFDIPKAFHFLGGLNVTFVALTFGALLLWALAPGRRLGQNVLRHPFLTRLGMYSYGLYVIHGILRPSLAWTYDHYFGFLFDWAPVLNALIHIVTATAISLLLAALSFHCFEAQFLNLKRFFQYGSTNAADGKQASGPHAKRHPLAVEKVG